ncbi:MAG: alpha/beta fold hydrolase [Bdellovibrionaceae bacterium]|nr:alpha/beta fold hydrolase [Pseudobdellovibrionaceae bacterium]
MKLIWITIIFLTTTAHAYIESKVSFPINSKTNLEGFIATPNEPGNYPILVLQMGSGKGTTDNEKRSYYPFAILARAVADIGFVILRFDKRGTGYNQTNGSYADGTFTDYVNDLKVAVKFMQSQPNTISDDVHLYGHSLGGPVATIAALELSDLKGIILSASPGRRYSEFNFEQMKYLYEFGQGLDGQDLQKALISVQNENNLISKPKEFCSKFSLQCEIKNEKYYLNGQSSEFWKELVALNPISPLLQLSCSIFSIHGTRDWVISSENDGGAIQKALSANPNYTSQVLPNLDHFLTEADSKKISAKLFMEGLPDKKAKLHPQYIAEIISKLQDWEFNE